MQPGNVLFQGGGDNYYSPSTNLEFQQFSYAEKSGTQGNVGSSNYAQAYPPSTYAYQQTGTGEVTWASIRAAFTTGGFADEPPLLEELGINFSHIKKKGVTVLNPLRAVDKHIMDDTDLAGPILFVLLFGGFLLLSGKINFGYVYGVAMLGCVSVYAILNLMSESGIDGYRTASVLGYCLLPMVVLSSVATLLQLSGHIVGLILSALSVLWCTYSASKMFTTVLSMSEQRLLVAYPVGLLYSAFALLAIF
ncbi:transporter YIP1 [Spizellomyces punctatus DAOM BR117]|uniref:Protein YIP n=1 Tax=Spizellomyces punctatus (strain DAOM BR117) TaxID=645134 RepID=A0A0L0HVN1_SPIPD|nr:transporter YIP1 [Spizellomyces punctatus DAOM BR117]KND05137.1 hypothetical protein SPPG_00806 [Spizellomyces punctatus DAOM BR117]|eukprot:XP_016613176.1 hypothetical protein SPPG_00806 [Spizellomyces punctatus DAOM BR117]